MTTTEQEEIDRKRRAVAREIAESRAVGEDWPEDAIQFAANWIETAAQHADNEVYFRKERDLLQVKLDEARRELEIDAIQIAQLRILANKASP